MDPTPTLSPREADAIWTEASRWQTSLRLRTEGITWMIWGATTAAILMTVGFTTVSGLAPAAVIASWTPWVLIGAILTMAVWRSAALSKPTEIRAPGAWTYIAGVAAVVALFLLLHLVVRPQTMAGPMAMLGIGWMVAAVVPLRTSRLGRRVRMLIGLAIVASAIVLELISAGMVATMLIGTGLLVLIPLALGTYQTLQG